MYIGCGIAIWQARMKVMEQQCPLDWKHRHRISDVITKLVSSCGVADAYRTDGIEAWEGVTMWAQQLQSESLPHVVHQGTKFNGSVRGVIKLRECYSCLVFFGILHLC